MRNRLESPPKIKAESGYDMMATQSRGFPSPLTNHPQFNVKCAKCGISQPREQMQRHRTRFLCKDQTLCKNRYAEKLNEPITLLWADEFRKIVASNKNKSGRAIQTFLRYCEEQEYNINKRWTNEKSERRSDGDQQNKHIPGT